MKEAVKIVTIGGGSSYTPELMEGFIKRYEDLPIREIWLVDIEDGKEKVKPQPVVKDNHIGRNDPCPCGSGKKYKQCCGRFAE